MEILEEKSHGVLHSELRGFGRALEIPIGNIEKVANDKLLNKLTLSDALNQFLHQWKVRKGQDATLQELLAILTRLKLKDCAGKYF